LNARGQFQRVAFCASGDTEIYSGSQPSRYRVGCFPVNFDGRVNCVPAHYIQPTPTMMCAAAVQAVRSTRKGLLPLDPAFGRWLDAEFRIELDAGRHGELNPCPPLWR
jgi:hypothetical protein